MSLIVVFSYYQCGFHTSVITKELCSLFSTCSRSFSKPGNSEPQVHLGSSVALFFFRMLVLLFNIDTDVILKGDLECVLGFGLYAVRFSSDSHQQQY